MPVEKHVTLLSPVEIGAQRLHERATAAAPNYESTSAERSNACRARSTRTSMRAL
jgi:hypothetical protein